MAASTAFSDYLCRIQDPRLPKVVEKLVELIPASAKGHSEITEHLRDASRQFVGETFGASDGLQ
jgi:hypothetical protein